ncbi:hypothetical protein O9929_23495 [Vibrio lentus]|nr:hypothetical protein [Vibrio lentus]
MAWRQLHNISGKQLGLETLIFAYTADAFREAHDNFIKAGADHILTKPLQQESFFDALQQFSTRLPQHPKGPNGHK